MNSPHKGPVRQQSSPFDDVIIVTDCRSYKEEHLPTSVQSLLSCPCRNGTVTMVSCSIGAGINTSNCMYQKLRDHDDVIKLKHFPRYWPFVRGIHRSPVNSPHKGQWRGALMFSLICVWINGWVNNREAGDLRRYRAHHDVAVMI